MTLASGVDAGASAGAHALARYRSEFPIFRHAVCLNAGSLGALGDRTRRRMAEFFDLWQARGASAWYDVWWAALSELRARYARVVGASPDEIALAPSVSVALSAVAEALDYGRRPKIVVTSLDFPTVAYQWLAKRARGVELVVVQSPDQVSVPVDAIARAVDDRTALVATSHVYFTSGAIQDIKRVAARGARGGLRAARGPRLHRRNRRPRYSPGDGCAHGGLGRAGGGVRLPAQGGSPRRGSFGDRDAPRGRPGGGRATSRRRRDHRGRPTGTRPSLSFLL